MIAHALRNLRTGQAIVVTDDVGQGADLVFGAEFACADLVATMVRHTGGFICAAMTGRRADELGLPSQHRTFPPDGIPRYCVAVDAADGIGTGISAHDRAATLRLLAAEDTQPEELTRPGHVVTAKVDLLRLDSLVGAEARLATAVLLASNAGVRPVIASSTLLTVEERRLGASDLDDDVLMASFARVSISEVRRDRMLLPRTA